MCKRFLVLTVMMGMLACTAGPLFSAYDGDVLIGGEVILRVRYPAGGMSVKQRAETVMLRVNELLGTRPFYPSEVRVAVRNKEHVVMVGDKVIITVDKRTAEYNSATPEQLANMWAANLRRVIPKAKAE